MKTYKEEKAEFLIKFVRKALKVSKGNVTKAAQKAGTTPANFWKLMQRASVRPTEFRAK
jgi:DNA-binding NtrC family response regulator